MVTMTLLQGVINAFVMFFARLIAFAISNSGNNRRERGYYGGGSYMIVWILQIVLGIFGSIITAWFSRQREFRADRGGALLAGRDRMIAALRRLQANREMVDTSQQQLATLKINDVPGWTSLFSTHPSLEVRIAALERMT
jgi:heat shock protein HtpX